MTDGGVVTEAELIEGDHNITGVKVTQDGDNVVLRCPCGWTSRPHQRTRNAVVEWQRHRDSVTQF